MRLPILLIVVSTILSSSCTIQKRSFRNGYYISWHKSGPKEKPGSKEQPAETKTESLAGSTTSTDTLIVCKEEPNPAEDLAVIEKPDSLQPMDSLLTEETQPTKRSAERYSEKALLERLSEVVESIKAGQTNNEYEEGEPSHKRLNLFALNAFPFAIGYVVLIFYAVDQGNVNWPIALAISCLFLAIILAVIGIVKWKRNKSKFWGTFFALMALITLALGTFLLLVAFMSGGF